MEDLIKREDAIKGKMAGTANANAEFLMGMDERERRIFSIGYADGWNEHIDKCKYDIPAVEPKQGEWIDRSDGGRILNPWWENYECNRCGYYGSGTWNFCPNCGARMTDRDIDVPYKIASDQRDYDSTYEPTYNDQDGSM